MKNARLFTTTFVDIDGVRVIASCNMMGVLTMTTIGLCTLDAYTFNKPGNQGSN